MSKTPVLGQHFLVNRNVAEKIAQSLFPVSGYILEIGPGKGVLTDLLLRFRDQDSNGVIAVELDTKWYQFLQEKYLEKQQVGNFELINRDFLSLDLANIVRVCFPGPSGDNEKQLLNITGNLPYYISKEIIDRVIQQHQLICKGVFMMQKEFVEKLLPDVGNTKKNKKNKKKKNAQSFIFNYLFSAVKLFDVQPGSFSPPPKVTSSVFSFESRGGLENWPIMVDDIQVFYHFLQESFRDRRKTLFNNLKRWVSDEGLIENFMVAGIPLERRAEECNLEEFIALFRLCSSQF